MPADHIAAPSASAIVFVQPRLTILLTSRFVQTLYMRPMPLRWARFQTSSSSSHSLGCILWTCELPQALFRVHPGPMLLSVLILRGGLHVGVRAKTQCAFHGTKLLISEWKFGQSKLRHDQHRPKTKQPINSHPVFPLKPRRSHSVIDIRENAAL